MKKVLLIGLFACIALSCEDEVYTNIPAAQVNLTLYLNDIDKELWNIYKPQIYTFQKPNGHTGQAERFGYGGILVINTGGTTGVNLLAYDVACQVEADRTAVVPDSTGLYAKCPKCGAIYNIASSGAPVTGSKYSLHQYKVFPGKLTNSYVVIN